MTGISLKFLGEYHLKSQQKDYKKAIYAKVSSQQDYLRENYGKNKLNIAFVSHS